MRTKRTNLGIGLILLLLLLTACSQATSAPTASATSHPATTAQATRTQAPRASLTASVTATLTPTRTAFPSPTLTPSLTLSPTYALPEVVVNTQAHCRYGPSIAYLHAADLYPGDRGVVWGRFAHSAWLQVKFDKLAYACWAAPSVIDVHGDTSLIYYTEPNLKDVGSNSYGPPEQVKATRSGNQVTITWKRIGMTVDDDRGYFIEAFVCQNGFYLWWTVSFPDQYTTRYTVQDDLDCKQPSSGEIRSVEKHGYSEPVPIPWP